jgi:hypothetical protein
VTESYQHVIDKREIVVSHRIGTEIQPEIAFFGIQNEDFRSNSGWRGLIDLLARHGPYNVLTVTMRCQGHPITAPETRALFQRLVNHARQLGVDVVLDLDPRLARTEFRRRHPDEQQRIVYLQRCPLEGGEAEFAQEPEAWHDHMTGRGTPYRVEAGQFVRAIAWRLTADGSVVPGSQHDVSGLAVVERDGAAGVAGRLAEVEDADEVLVMTEFNLFTPDVFSPHLVHYQQELLELYADLPLGGVIKDEWGFPPTVKSLTEHRSFWYSPFYDQAYAQATHGRSLLDDLPLLAVPVDGDPAERLAAISCYMSLNLRRQTEIEDQYYHGVKAVYGAEALVTKHATWYPRINAMEIFKNGISWWAATRDIAQTDEITPLSAALGMAKKFGSPIWLNEGYAERPEHYRRNIWRYALAGGRMVFHPLYPTVNGKPADPQDPHHGTHSLLLTRELLQAECRVRLLSFISTAPLDCPVAFVFGHQRVMNWGAAGYLDYGEELSLDLWRNGYAVDLYPSTEIATGTFQVDADGWVRVGCQHYQLLVLYCPDLCPAEVADFFRRNRITRTALVVIGPWSRNSRGQAMDGLAQLPTRFTRLDAGEEVLASLLAELERRQARRQPPLVEPYILFSNDQIAMPAPQGTCYLVDGTVVRIAATGASDGGDPIREVLEISGVQVDVEAEGIFAAHVDSGGNLDALAAGGLRRVHSGAFHLELDEPLDLALWRTPDGRWHGVAQGLSPDDPLPPALDALTGAWQLLSVPPPYDHRSAQCPVAEIG